MKNSLFILISLVLTFSVSSHAAGGKEKKAFSREYGMAGCGLGSVIIGKKGGQIFASTTNDLSLNQMIGITAGSLNCMDQASSEVASQVDTFILANRSQIQGDIAKGNGETVSTLATVLGCEKQSSQVGVELKNNYEVIFSDGAYTNEITDSIISVIKNNKELSAQCNHLS